MSDGIIVSKCFSVTTATSFLDGYHSIVYAETPAKARMKAIYEWDLDDIKWGIVNSRVRRFKENDLMQNTPHELVSKLSQEQIHKALHAIGVDKACRNPYRNRYVSDTDEDFEYLISLGLAEKNGMNKEVFEDQWMYHLTELGIDVVLSTKPKIRNQQ